MLLVLLINIFLNSQLSDNPTKCQQNNPHSSPGLLSTKPRTQEEKEMVRSGEGRKVGEHMCLYMCTVVDIHG